MRTRKILIGILIGGLVIFALGIGAFFLWASDSHPPMPEALATLETDEYVQVALEPWITFTPAGEQPITGFIFYPGGLVEPEAYAPTARAIAPTDMPGFGEALTIAPGHKVQCCLAIFREQFQTVVA